MPKNIISTLNIDSKSGLTPWENLPRIDLYMDQLLIIMHEELQGLWVELSEGKISASMVNNYVKVKLVPAPVKKRYERKHICALLIVFVLKPILSMQDLNLLIPALLKEFSEDWSKLHAAFGEHLERILNEEEIPDTHHGPYETVLIHALSAFSERLRVAKLLHELEKEDKRAKSAK